MPNPSRFDQHVNLTRLNSCEGHLRIANLSIEEPYALCGVQNYVASHDQSPHIEFRSAAGRHISKSLQRSQEGHQATILAPVAVLLAGFADVAFRECASFHLQVDLGIDIGCVDRNMSQPRPNGVDIDTGAQQMNGSCVSDSMWANLFGSYCRYLDSNFGHVAFDHFMDSKSCNGPTATVEKNSFCGATTVDCHLQGVRCDGPQRAMANLIAFTQDCYGCRE
jgi:hypothetical protein